MKRAWLFGISILILLGMLGGIGSQTVLAHQSIPYDKFRADVYEGKNFERCVGSLSEYSINHWWETGGPCGLTDNFSIRWQGRFYFEPGQYQFRVRVDDGTKLWVDNRLVINKWIKQAVTTYETKVYLSRGYHNIKLEYFEWIGGAIIGLDWRQVEPSENYLLNGFRADVYEGKNFERCVGSLSEYSINHWWETGGPCGLTDNFSIRWQGNFCFPVSCCYLFRVTADDGFRLWVDGGLVMDSWIYQPATAYETCFYLSGGYHNIKLEYFEATGGAIITLNWELDP